MTLQIIVHVGERAKNFLKFFIRRFKNVFMVMVITIGFIYFHCSLKEQSANSQFCKPMWGSAKHIKRLGFSLSDTRGQWEARDAHFRKLKFDQHSDLLRSTSGIVSISHSRPALLRKIQDVEKRANDNDGAYMAKAVLQARKTNKEWVNNGWKSETADPKYKPMAKFPLAQPQQKSESRKFWLDEFTSQIPRNLQVLLQDILLRDFERFNASGEVKRCGRGYFRLRGMNSCRKWLQCNETEEIVGADIYGSGMGKISRAAKWRNIHDVAIVTLRKDRHQNQYFVDRVQSGLDNMLLAQSSPYVTQVVGVCNRGNTTVLVMEGCTRGSFRNFYNSAHFRRLSPLQKFKFAIQIVSEYDFLHRGLDLPRVHCDIHAIMQAFGQWVVSSDLRLFLNDLDEIPPVDKRSNTLAACECEANGIMEMREFQAPETRYTQDECEKGISKKPVNEAADIWKIPDLISNILMATPGKRYFEVFAKQNSDYYFKPQLKQIHGRCKRMNPAQRPTSREILIEYLKLYEHLVKADVENRRARITGVKNYAYV